VIICQPGWEEPDTEPWRRPSRREHLYHVVQAPTGGSLFSTRRKPTSTASPRSMARPWLALLSRGLEDSFLVLQVAIAAARGVVACIHRVFLPMFQHRWVSIVPSLIWGRARSSFHLLSTWCLIMEVLDVQFTYVLYLFVLSLLYVLDYLRDPRLGRKRRGETIRALGRGTAPQ